MTRVTVILEGENVKGVLVHEDDDADVQALLEDILKVNQADGYDPITVMEQAPDTVRGVRAELNLDEVLTDLYPADDEQVDTLGDAQADDTRPDR